MKAVFWISLVCIGCLFSYQSQSTSPLTESVNELRHVKGDWQVTTKFISAQGDVAKEVEGTYHFDWIVEDRVLSGRSAIPELTAQSGLMFYINEGEQVIEMISVGADGRLWVMTGPLGSDVRSTEEFTTPEGTLQKLRFTRFNVQQDSFESKMEYSSDGGQTWKKGNHQVFSRIN